jgi:hypothetical protein
MGGHNIRYNKDIEKWNAFRENTHRWFRFSSRNVPTLLVTCAVLPYGLYRWVVGEQRQVDERNGVKHDYM